MDIDVKNEGLEAILSDEIDLDINQEELELETPPAPEKIRVSSGAALSTDDIYKIAARESAKMIVLIGPVASGKTTIETSLYQMFQNSPVKEFYFAGSNSLHGFEQRAFYTRIKSKGYEPQTQRTIIGDRHAFLHLRLYNSSKEIINNLVLADISGEAFTNHIGDVNEVKKSFPFIERADYLVGVIDCGKLCNKKTRNSTVSEIIELVRTFWDAELIMDECILQMVFSKFDILAEIEDIDSILDRAKRQITTRLADFFKKIEFYNVAAMPPVVDKFSVGYGLELLLQDWLKKHVTKCSVEMDKTMDKIFYELTEYDRLYCKFLGELDE